MGKHILYSTHKSFNAAWRKAHKVKRELGLRVAVGTDKALVNGRYPVYLIEDPYPPIENCQILS